MGLVLIRWMQARAGQGPAESARKDIERHIIEKGRHPDHGRADDPGRPARAAPSSGADLANIYVWVAILGHRLSLRLCSGFLDDPRLGHQVRAPPSISGRLAIEFLVAFAGILVMIKFGPQAPEPHLSTSLAFPVFKKILLNLGWFYVAFAGVVIVGAANAVNFTDGLDGLAIGAGDDRRMVTSRRHRLIWWGTLSSPNYLQASLRARRR